MVHRLLFMESFVCCQSAGEAIGGFLAVVFGFPIVITGRRGFSILAKRTRLSGRTDPSKNPSVKSNYVPVRTNTDVKGRHKLEPQQLETGQDLALHDSGILDSGILDICVALPNRLSGSSRNTFDPSFPVFSFSFLMSGSSADEEM